MTQDVTVTEHNVVNPVSTDANGDVVTDPSGNSAVNAVIADAHESHVDFRDQPAGNVRTMTGISAQTAAITATKVYVIADAECAIAVGTNPTAVFNTSFHLAANAKEIVKIVSGDKIAAISGGAGNLYYHPVV